VIGYLFRRTLSAVPVLFGVATLVFFFLHFIPGDPVALMLGESALPVQQEELRSKLHLNEPILKQYARFLGGTVRGDLGRSIWTDEPVTDRILRRYPATLQLAGAALLVACLIALPLGLLAAARRRSIWDTTTMTFSLAGLSIPAFWLGPMLMIVFSHWLGWFPVSGRDEFLSIVLPAVTLGTGMAALLARMSRASVADVLAEKFIQTAWAKGASPRSVFWKHALRNALIPIVTVIGLQTGALLAGAVITEKVFSWPGIGLEMIEAIERRDYPLVQGCVLIVAVSYVLINLLTDLAYAWIDPRVRLFGERTGEVGD
jgi:peptide/nickel transport system permease protein